MKKRKNYLGIAIVLWFSGCGYVIEGSNPVLPNGARTLAVLPIQNQTFQADLETYLAEQLNRLLRSNSSVRLVSSGQADLKLSITLLKLKTATSGLSQDHISAGAGTGLQGWAVLEDGRSGRTLWKEKMFTVELSASGGNGTSGTNSSSGFSLSGSLRELTRLFAEKLYQRLFFTF